jgi:hypothetical protein
MSILNIFKASKTHYKRTKEEIQHFKILTDNQKKIIESYKFRALAAESESKALRKTLFDLDDMQRDLGIDAFEQNDSPIISNGAFNFSDLLVKVLKGLKPDSIPGGKNTLAAASDLIASQSNEINALASHQIQNLVKNQTENQVIPK